MRELKILLKTSTIKRDYIIDYINEMMDEIDKALLLYIKVFTKRYFNIYDMVNIEDIVYDFNDTIDIFYNENKDIVSNEVLNAAFFNIFNDLIDIFKSTSIYMITIEINIYLSNKNYKNIRMYKDKDFHIINSKIFFDTPNFTLDNIREYTYEINIIDIFRIDNIFYYNIIKEEDK